MTKTGGAPGALAPRTSGEPNATPLIDDLAAHFRSRTRAVVVVPYDPALESGSNIEYGMLAAATKRAWLRAAAVMMAPYVR